MQKKKTSTTAIAGVALIVCGILGFNITNGTINLDAFKKKEVVQAPGFVPNNSPVLAKKENAEALKVSASPDGAPMDGTGETTIPDYPAIFPPKHVRFNVAANPTVTSGQWWKDDAAVNEEGQKVRKDRDVNAR